MSPCKKCGAEAHKSSFSNAGFTIFEPQDIHVVECSAFPNGKDDHPVVFADTEEEAVERWETEAVCRP